MNKSVKRKDIKYNFLKKIIIRVDFNGILERELEKSIEELKVYFKEKMFNRFYESFINEVDFEIKDPEQIETQRMIPINELRKTKSYIFCKEENAIEVQISKYFMSVTIDYNKYIEFETISKLFYEAFKKIVDNNNYIRVLRLGLRKINNCILLELSRLDEIVKMNFFLNLNSYLVIYDLPILNKQNIDTFIYKNTNVNLIRYLSGGTLSLDGEDKDAYQLVLDIDSYKNDEEYLNGIILNDKVYEELIEYNTILFNTYINLLNDNFVSCLQSGVFDNTLVLGVEKND
jgi:uncharacterized protein (TIGR04255 family)